MKELMHTTPEGLTGADATWAAGVMERDRAQRNAAIARAEAAEAKLAEVTKERDVLKGSSAADAALTASNLMSVCRQRNQAHALLDAVAETVGLPLLVDERHAEVPSAVAELARERDALRRQLNDMTAQRDAWETNWRHASAGWDEARKAARPIGSEGPWKPRQPDGYDPDAPPWLTRDWRTPGSWAGSAAASTTASPRARGGACGTAWSGCR